MIVAGAVVATPAAAQDGATLAEVDGTGTEDDPYVVTNAEELQAMNGDVDAHYVLDADIDASDTESWNARSGFVPIGTDDEPFTGSFDGQGHTITGLTIDRPGEDDIGLFAYTNEESEIRNVSLDDAFVRGEDHVGIVVGFNNGLVDRATAAGTVEGSQTVGGIAGGSSESAEISNVGADADVTGSDRSTGGAVGWNEGPIYRAYATGDVSGTDGVGGLLGENQGDTRSSYATGDVSGQEDVGGLIGNGGYTAGTVRNAYATGDVDGQENAGGLLGMNPGTVTAVYATGDVSGESRIGGITGDRDADPANYDPQLYDAYWDTEASAASDAIGYIGFHEDSIDLTELDTGEMTGADATRNLDKLAFGDVYAPTDEYPVFQWQVEDVDVSLDDATLTEGQHTDVTVTLSLTDGTTVTASEVAAYDAGTSIATVDAGTLTAESEGETDVSATVAGQSDTATLDVLEPPEISQTDAGIDAEGVVNGSTATITASYENTGGMEGDHTAELVVDGETVDTDTVTVGLDAEETVEFEFTPDAAGDYDVAVDGTDVGTLTAVERGTVSVTGVDAPEKIGEGTPYEIDVSLSNDADVAVAETVIYQVDGEDAVTESVAVGADGATATLEHAADATGSVDHRVAVADTEATASSEVVEPPAFGVAELDAPDAVEAGETAEITATIENSGGIEHTRAVTVRYGGENVTTTNVTLAPGESTEVTAEVTADEAGDVAYAASVADASREGTMTVEEAGQNGDDGSSGFGVGAALAALLGGAAASRRRL